MICYIDGGYDNINKRNPYISFKVYDDNGNLVTHVERATVPATTNNEAEYWALIHCLNYLQTNASWSNEIHTIYSDSSLLVNQVMGKWVINKPHLAKLVSYVYSYDVKYKLLWVSRKTIVKELGH
jgi:ribonuclease HI